MPEVIEQPRMLCSGDASSLTIERSDLGTLIGSISDFIAEVDAPKSPLRIPPVIDIELNLEPALRSQFLSFIRPDTEALAAFEEPDDEDGGKIGDRFWDWDVWENCPQSPINLGTRVDGVEYGWYQTDSPIWQLVPSNFGQISEICGVGTRSVGLTGWASVTAWWGSEASLLSLFMDDVTPEYLIRYGLNQDNLLTHAVRWGLSIEPNWYDGGPGGGWCPACTEESGDPDGLDNDDCTYLSIDATKVVSSESIGSALGILWKPCEKHLEVPISSSGRDWKWNGSTWVC